MGRAEVRSYRFTEFFKRDIPSFQAGPKEWKFHRGRAVNWDRKKLIIIWATKKLMATANAFWWAHDSY